MRPFALSWEEIQSCLAKGSPNPNTHELVEFRCEIDPLHQHIFLFDAACRSKASSETVLLRFRDVWLNNVPGELSLPYPLGCGLLVVDVRARQWEWPFVVVADDEDSRTLFGCREFEARVA